MRIIKPFKEALDFNRWNKGDGMMDVALDSFVPFQTINESTSNVYTGVLFNVGSWTEGEPNSDTEDCVCCFGHQNGKCYDTDCDNEEMPSFFQVGKDVEHIIR